MPGSRQVCRRSANSAFTLRFPAIEDLIGPLREPARRNVAGAPGVGLTVRCPQPTNARVSMSLATPPEPPAALYLVAALLALGRVRRCCGTGSPICLEARSAVSCRAPTGSPGMSPRRWPAMGSTFCSRCATLAPGETWPGFRWFAIAVKDDGPGLAEAGCRRRSGILPPIWAGAAAGLRPALPSWADGRHLRRREPARRWVPDRPAPAGPRRRRVPVACPRPGIDVWHARGGAPASGEDFWRSSYNTCMYTTLILVSLQH
ncbi:MAG: hypothetical protein JWR00_1642 [Rubritepida sp.]|nr:hypothetical protein [Rubritepida sp.]